MQLYYNSVDDILYFCSERGIMQEALGIKSAYKRGFSLGESNYHYYEMEDNHSLIINKQGIESYKNYQPRYSWGYTSFINEPFDDDLMMIECPYCLGMTDYNWNEPENRCQNCRQIIIEEDMYV